MKKKHQPRQRARKASPKQETKVRQDLRLHEEAIVSLARAGNLSNYIRRKDRLKDPTVNGRVTEERHGKVWTHLSVNAIILPQSSSFTITFPFGTA